MTTTDTLIVGAGPYGLSIAAHLRAQAMEYQIVGRPLESWHTFMPEGMILKSEAFASNLWDPDRAYTLERYCEERGISYRPSREPLSLERFLAYATWFQQRAVGNVLDARVRDIASVPNGFRISFADGTELHARRVVLATGHMPYMFVPPPLRTLPTHLCAHSAVMGDVRLYSGREVTVVGAGQSALESAVLLHEAGAKVRLLARASRIQWGGPPAPGERSFFQSIRQPEAGLGYGWKTLLVSELPQMFRRVFRAETRHWYVARSWGPSGAYWLRERFEGCVEPVLGRNIESAATTSDGRVALVTFGPDGRQEIRTSHVIAGTGYQVDLNRLDFLDPALRAQIALEGSLPRLSAHFESSVPGLFIVGITSAPVFGPVMRFMFGAKHAAPVITRRLKSAAAVQSVTLRQTSEERQSVP